MDHKILAEELQKAALSCGAAQAGLIPVSALTFHDQIRRICEGNSCRSYNKTWACPPAVGTLDECRSKCQQYSSMLLFSGVYPLEDPFDLDGMSAGHGAFKDLTDRIGEKASCLTDHFLLLSNEGCKRCSKCTWPDAPCRFPEKLYPSLEGFGFIVSELATLAGVRYISGKNTVSYFGAIFF